MLTEYQRNQYYKYYDLSGVPKDQLKNEEHFNLYRRPKKQRQSQLPRVIVWREGATHQADLAEMPLDPQGYHYFLVVVELARRRVDAEPIKNKTSQEVLNAFIRIYQRGCIPPPTRRIETDSGTEFTNAQVRDFFLQTMGVMMRFGKPGRHKQQSYAERAIQEIQRPLNKRMGAQEQRTGVPSTEWVTDFHDIVQKVDEKWQRRPPTILIGPPKVDRKTELLPEGTRVRVKLDEPISMLGQKLHGKFRTGDIRWHPRLRVVKKLMLSPDQPPTYLLDGTHGRLGVSRCAYTRGELQVIPANERPPPDSVFRGRPDRYIAEQILDRRGRQYLVKWKYYPERMATWEPAKNIEEDVPELVRDFVGIRSSAS